MADFRIRARIEPAGSDTFVAKVWVLRADESEEHAPDVADVCHPCTLLEVHANCGRFIDQVVKRLVKEGHRVHEVRIL